MGPSALIQWLEEELRQAISPENRALLAHQLGVLYERIQRPEVALTQLLAASNEVSTFAEPLAQIQRLLEKHQSFSNLGPLIERLLEVAPSGARRAQALLAGAWWHINHSGDLEAARRHTLDALAEEDNNSVAAFTLEIVAYRLKDFSLSQRALLLRQRTTDDPTLREALLVDFIRRASQNDDPTAAQNPIEVSEENPGFERLEEVEFQPLGEHAHEHLYESLLRRLHLVADALKKQPPCQDSSSLPPDALTKAYSLQLSLRAGIELNAQGRFAEASELLNSVAKAHSSLDLSRLAFRSAYLSSDIQTAEALALAEPFKDSTGPAAASLLLQLAELRLREHQEGAALKAFALAKEQDPSCLLAHARHMDLLQAQGDGAGFADALEVWADTNSVPRSKSQPWLLSAEAWARQANQPDSARSALKSAVDCGLPPTVAHRLGRALAHCLNDSDWYAEETHSLAQCPQLTTTEVAALRVEELHNAALDFALTDAEDLIAELSTVPEAHFLSQLLLAFDIGVQSDRRSSALSQLAHHRTAPEPSTTLRWLAALDAHATGDVEQAISMLQSLLATRPFCPRAAGTLCGLLEQQNLDRVHARTLRNVASATSDRVLATGLLLEAGLLEFWEKDFSASRECFEQAQSHGSKSAELLLEWCGFEDSVSAPSRASLLDSLLDDLHQFATSSSPDPELRRRLDSALESPEASNEVEFCIAADLLELVRSLRAPITAWHPAHRRLLTRGKLGLALSTELDYIRTVTASAQPDALEHVAKGWAKASGELSAHLEWLDRAQTASRHLASAEALSGLAHISPESVAPAILSAEALRRVSMGALRPEPLTSEDPASILVNLELAPAGSAVEDRASALSAAATVFGEESGALGSLLAGYNWLAANQLDKAADNFDRYATEFPGDPAGWEGLISAASLGAGTRTQLDKAVSGLLESGVEPSTGADLLERAADVYDSQYSDPAATLSSLRSAVDLDASRASSLAKLQGLLSEPDQQEEVLNLAEKAIAANPSSEQELRLTWTIALTLRKLGRDDNALDTAQKVLALDPGNSKALALVGEICIATGRHEQAIEPLSTLASLPTASSEQRLASGIAAVDLLENKLDDTGQALELLLKLHRGGMGTLAVRERIARSAVKIEAWADAVVVLEQLMLERDTPLERIEAARMALTIHRDKLKTPHAAGHAVETLLELSPGDPEALDLVTSKTLEPSLSRSLTDQGKSILVARLASGKINTTDVELVAVIAQQTKDRPLRQVALGSLLSLGQAKSSHIAELAMLEQSSPARPVANADRRGLLELEASIEPNPLFDLCQLVLPHLPPQLLPSLHSLGLKPKDRVDTSSPSPLQDEVQHWAQLLGVTEFEMYISTANPNSIVVLSDPTPAIVVGFKVTAPLVPMHRQELSQGLFAHRTGYDLLQSLGPEQTTQVLSCLCQLAGMSSAFPHTLCSPEVEKAVRRALPRKVRKSLPGWRQGVEDLQPETWVSEGQLRLDQIAMLSSGDPSWVLGHAGLIARGTSLANTNETARIHPLLQFAFSSTYASIRGQWGMNAND